MRIFKKITSIFFIFILFIMLEFLTYTEILSSILILIHGTWGADCDWYLPRGDFFEALEQTVSEKNSVVVSFRWSGGCSHEARINAAHSLVKLIKTYSISTAVFIIAHSHGGNVATLA